MFAIKRNNYIAKSFFLFSHLDLSPVPFVELDALRVKHDLLKEVQALAEMKCGKIMVASGSGLHFLTKAG